MSDGAVIAIIGVISAIVGGIITAAAGLVPAILRKDSAISEAWKPLADAQQALSDDLRAENADLRQRLETLEERDRIRQQSHDKLTGEFEVVDARAAWQAGEIERLGRRLNAQTAMHSASMDALRTELDMERRKRARLELWVKRLEAQLVEAGIEPVPRPRMEEVNGEEY